jgi:hypothetical protein
MLERPGEQPEMEMEEAVAPEAEEPSDGAVQIPSSIVGDQPVNPGDVLRLEVVSVDSENGVINVKYSKPAATSKKLGTEALASAFD